MWVVSGDVSEALLEATAIREISMKIQESARKYLILLYFRET